MAGVEFVVGSSVPASVWGGSTVSDNIDAAVRSVSSVMRSNTTLSSGWRWISDVVNAFMRKYLSRPYNL